jgi:2-dehydro-3-deoxyphosphogalactonate aldolase
MNTSPTPLSQWRQGLDHLPLVAILRGVQPQEVVAIGQALVDAGWHLIEVPLNSPDPLRSITLLREHLPQALIGAGTVCTAQEVREVQAAAGQWIVSPHFDPAVVRESVASGLVSVPGVSTPSEAFAALAAGAHGLKLFPAEMITPMVLKSWRSVLPKSHVLLPVGGVGADNLASYRAAGASGAGFGSSLYKPGLRAQEVGERARHLAQVWQAAAS